MNLKNVVFGHLAISDSLWTSVKCSTVSEKMPFGFKLQAQLLIQLVLQINKADVIINIHTVVKTKNITSVTKTCDMFLCGDTL